MIIIKLYLIFNFYFYMNKILVTIFVFFCLLFSFSNVNAISWSDFKAFIVSKKELSETVKWKQYIYKMDQILNKVSNNKEALGNLQIKVEWLNEKFKDNTSEEVKAVKNIINYLYWKTLILIGKLEKIELENNSIENNVNDSINDNIIKYIKVKDRNEIIFDLISWEKVNYDIYMDNKFIVSISGSGPNIKQWGDLLYYWSVDFWKYTYTVWGHDFEIKAYRNSEFITSIHPTYKILLLKNDDTVIENKLSKYLFTVSKKEIEIWEYIDLTIKWINEDGSIHILDSKYNHNIHFPGFNFDDGSYGWTSFRNAFPYSMKWNEMSTTLKSFTKFTSPWTKIIKWCFERDKYTCGAIEVNVTDND